MTERKSQIDDAVDPRRECAPTYQLIEVSVPFEQRYIPFRHRNIEVAHLSRNHALAIRTFTSEQAPIAYRIHAVDDDRLPPLEIRIHGDRYWWPLLYGAQSVARESFVALASSSHHVLSVLFNPWTYPGHSGPTLENLLRSSPKCRLGESSFEAQAGFVNRGADRIAFCEDGVLIAAGPPIYFGLRSSNYQELSVVGDGIHAGASSLAVTQRDGYALPGPDRYDRRTAAARGLAFEAAELEHLTIAMAEDRMPSHLRSRIETILSSELDAAPTACMMGLVEKLWIGASPSNGLDWPWLRRYVPSLADAGKRSADFELLPHRNVLDEFISFDGSTDIRQLKADAGIARAIAERLQNMKRPLSKEEDDALFGFQGLGIGPSTARSKLGPAM